MQTLTSPFSIYVQGLQDGRIRILVSNQSYVIYWIVFLVLAVALYAATARSIFANAVKSNLSVGFAAAAAQVTGMFAVVVSFYLVFVFSPAKAEAWFLEITLLFAWFIYFFFAMATAPAGR
jgi:hypothetical protein